MKWQHSAREIPLTVNCGAKNLYRNDLQPTSTSPLHQRSTLNFAKTFIEFQLIVFIEETLKGQEAAA